MASQPPTPVRQPRVATNAPPTTTGDATHLTLRVMRLSKPTFGVEPPVLTEANDVPSFANVESTLPTNLVSNASRGFGLAEMLTLPKSFGTIYVGEVFSSYINLFNHTNQDVQNVRLKAELQTKDKETVNRAPLTEKAPIIEVLSPGASSDYVVRRRLLEAGAHILVCAASYEVNGEKKSFRKFFKFSVLDPFKLKHRISYLKKEVFVELQITNATQLPLVFDSVNWAKSKYYTAQDMNAIFKQPQDDKSFTVTTGLAAGGVRNYLFKLHPTGTKKPATSGEGGSLRQSDKKGGEQGSKGKPSPTTSGETTPSSPPGTPKGGRTPGEAEPGQEDDFGMAADDDDDTTIGFVDVAWTSGLGEKARRRIPLYCKPMPEVPVELELLDVPATVYLEQPFTVVCKITNNHPVPIELYFRPNEKEMVGILFSGLSGMKLKELMPGSSLLHSITLFPLHPGIQQIVGIQVEDNRSNVVGVLDAIDVLVSYS